MDLNRAAPPLPHRAAPPLHRPHSPIVPARPTPVQSHLASSRRQGWGRPCCRRPPPGHGWIAALPGPQQGCRTPAFFELRGARCLRLVACFGEPVLLWQPASGLSWLPLAGHRRKADSPWVKGLWCGKSARVQRVHTVQWLTLEARYDRTLVQPLKGTLGQFLVALGNDVMLVHAGPCGPGSTYEFLGAQHVVEADHGQPAPAARTSGLQSRAALGAVGMGDVESDGGSSLTGTPSELCARSIMAAEPDRGPDVVPKRKPAVDGDVGQLTAVRPRFLALDELGVTLVEPSPVSADMDLECGPVCKWKLGPDAIAARCPNSNIKSTFWKGHCTYRLCARGASRRNVRVWCMQC